jgi:hypothetical protein
MIISHKHRFIFLKTSKTAGTSIEIALSRFCGPDDVITPISPEDEEKRHQLGGVGPQNHTGPLFGHSATQLWKRLIKNKPLQYFYNHIPARQVRKQIPADVWDSYTKFCVARNPWDRVISQYYWRQRHLSPEDMVPIAKFIKSKDVRSLVRKGYNLYTINNRMAVDYICRYEELTDDLEHLRLHLGLSEPLQLPQAKAGIRKDKRHYRDILNESNRDHIARKFRYEISLMGYEF